MNLEAWRVAVDGKTLLLCRDYHGVLWTEDRRSTKAKPGKQDQKLIAGQVLRAGNVATTRANALNLHRYVNPTMAFTWRGASYPASCGNCGEPAPGCPVCARGGRNLLVHQVLWVEGVLISRLACRWMGTLGGEQVKLGRVQLAWPRAGLSPGLAAFLVVLTSGGPVLVPEVDHAQARHDTPRWEKQPALWPELTLSPVNDTASPAPKDDPPSCAEKLPWID